MSKVPPIGIAIAVPPIRVDMFGGVLDLGNPKFNDVSKDIVQIMIDFSLMEIVEVYTM